MWLDLELIIGNPIEILFFDDNIQYWIEKSNWQKFRGEILIIFLEIQFFMFIKPKMMSPYQASKYNGKIRPTDPKNLAKP